MKKTIKFQSSALLPALSLAGKVVAPKNPIPVLSDFHIEAMQDNRLAITASDGETWLTLEAQAVEAETGTMLCVEAKSLLQIVSNLNGKDIDMEVDDERYTVNLKYDKGHCTLPYAAAADYPKPNMGFGEETIGTLGAKDIYDAINRASFAVGNDELRQVMNGVHFDFFAHGMVSVATDAKKLVKLTNLTITHDGSELGEVKNFTLPTKPCNALLSLLKDSEESIQYAFNDKNASFKAPTFFMVTRLVEGRYPNYDAVIPKESTKFATIDKAAFLTALKHVLPLGSQTTQLVALKFSTVITSQVDIIAQDFDFNRSAQESLECDYAGDDITIGFNGQSLMQIVQNVATEKFVLAMDTPQRAGVVQEDTPNEGYEYTSIIMPMMVNA